MSELFLTIAVDLFVECRFHMVPKKRKQLVTRQTQMGPKKTARLESLVANQHAGPPYARMGSSLNPPNWTRRVVHAITRGIPQPIRAYMTILQRDFPVLEMTLVLDAERLLLRSQASTVVHTKDDKKKKCDSDAAVRQGIVRSEKWWPTNWSMICPRSRATRKLMTTIPCLFCSSEKMRYVSRVTSRQAEDTAKATFPAISNAVYISS